MKWYVKEFSQMTKVSVRTLRHYDELGLLKPTLRLPNGYRMYSEADLLKLRQIIWLKFLGFGLSKIKTLFSTDKGNNAREYFRLQHWLIQEKLAHLQKVHEVFVEIMSVYEDKKLVDLKMILKLIETYFVTQKVKQQERSIHS